MSETQDKTMRFRGGVPIHPLAWASLAFVTTFMISAVFVQVIFGNGHPGLNGILVLVPTFLIPILIVFWPRPQFVRQIEIHSDNVIATARRGRTITIHADELQMISAESTMDWESRCTNPWGRLYLRSKRTWIVLKLHFAVAPECYREIVRRFPNVLGIPGQGELDVPAILDPATFANWADSIRKVARREIRRQVAFNLLNAVLLTSFAGIFILGITIGYIQKGSLPAGTITMALLVFAAGGGAASFVITGIRRKRVLRHVVQELSLAEQRLGSC
jgi:hypothetical protein